MCQMNEIPTWLLTPNNYLAVRSPSKLNFLRKTLTQINTIFVQEIYAAELASKKGFLQWIDARCKILILLTFMLITNLSHSFLILGSCLLISLIYAKLSLVNIKTIVKRVWLLMPLFLLVCSLPALLNLVVSGKPIVYLIQANPHSWLPNGLFLSDNGVMVVAKLVLKSGISLTFAYLLLVTTNWSELISALHRFKISQVFIAILDMTYRYIFLLAKIALQMSEARFLRSVANLPHAENRRFVGHLMALIFIKSSYLAEEVNSAMRLRGNLGKISTLKKFRLTTSDYVFVINNLLIMCVLFFISRV